MSLTMKWDMCSQAYFSLSSDSNPKHLLCPHSDVASVQILDCLFNIMSFELGKNQILRVPLSCWAGELIDISCPYFKTEDNYKKLMIEYLQFYWGQIKWMLQENTFIVDPSIQP